MAIGINDALQDFQVGQWAADLNSGFIELDADAHGDPAAGAAAVPSPVSGIAVAAGEAL